MNNLFKNICTKYVIIICTIPFASNILAQNIANPSCSLNNYKIEFQNYDSKVNLSLSSNLYRLGRIKSIGDTLQLTPLKFELTEIWSVSNTQKLPCMSRKTDIFKQSDILKNIKFHYAPNPSTWQGLGVLFMGITRVALFPTAPDFQP